MFKSYLSLPFGCSKMEIDYMCEVNRAELIYLLLPAPKVTPANVSGGGGSRSELVITWEVSKLAQDPLTHGGGSQTSLFSVDVGLCFINNS